MGAPRCDCGIDWAEGCGHPARLSRKPHGLHGPNLAFRCCDANGCSAEGIHRAPKSRDRLNEHYWFCLDHVRLYNRSWDYCAGLSEAEIEAMIRRDTIWQRPTWPLGAWQQRERDLRARVRRDYFEEEPASRSGAGTRRDAGQEHPAASTPMDEALRALDLEPPVSFTQVKARYRALVKIHHPDANGGDKASEERLKAINHAYNTLKGSFGLS